MKLFKRLIVIAIITVFAVITGSVTSDYSCNCREISFPFSVIAKLFEKEVKDLTDNNHKYERDENISLLEGVAFSREKAVKIKVTFIELGSVNCIPCKMMQPVMKEIERKYGDQVKVVFYDVWTKKGKPYAYKYGIRAIPTQVFLNNKGKEYFRHEGYFPFEEVEKILKKGGVR